MKYHHLIETTIACEFKRKFHLAMQWLSGGGYSRFPTVGPLSEIVQETGSIFKSP